jgi:hypothetical protein
VKFDGRNFWLPECWNTFVCGAATSSAMEKWRAGIDSACSKGAKTTFLGVLTVVGDGDRRG